MRTEKDLFECDGLGDGYVYVVKYNDEDLESSQYRISTATDEYNETGTNLDYHQLVLLHAALGEEINKVKEKVFQKHAKGGF